MSEDYEKKIRSFIPDQYDEVVFSDNQFVEDCINVYKNLDSDQQKKCLKFVKNLLESCSSDNDKINKIIKKIRDYGDNARPPSVRRSDRNLLIAPGPYYKSPSHSSRITNRLEDCDLPDVRQRVEQIDDLHLLTPPYVQTPPPIEPQFTDKPFDDLTNLTFEDELNELNALGDFNNELEAPSYSPVTDHEQMNDDNQPSSSNDENDQLTRYKATSTYNESLCGCTDKDDDPCSTDLCTNRALKFECNKFNCKNQDRCKNRRFTKQEHAKTEKFQSTIGNGLRALEEIKKDQFVGQIIDEDECNRRLNAMARSNDKNFYFMMIENNKILDAAHNGNLSRFMNHSCDPNMPP